MEKNVSTNCKETADFVIAVTPRQLNVGTVEHYSEPALTQSLHVVNVSNWDALIVLMLNVKVVLVVFIMMERGGRNVPRSLKDRIIT
jgi:hypothetical protein